MTAPSYKLLIQRGLLVLAALMPFHAFLSVSLGHFAGHQAIWQSWKELLIAGLALAAVLMVSRQQALLRKLKNPYTYAFAAFAGVALVVSLIFRPPSGAFIFGVKTDLEFLAVFTLAQLVGSREYAEKLIKVVLISSGLVIAFGLLQIYFLPSDWLAGFGYGPKTIQPFLRVDPLVDSVRIVSTLGGPNQLGSFLLIPLALIGWKLLNRPRWRQAVYLIAGLVVLWHTYARSAYLGLLVTAAVLVLLRLPSKWRLPALLVAVLAAGIGFNALIKASGTYPKLQFYIFHQSTTTATGFAASTDLHALALKQGYKTAFQHPLGEGLGAAGPASFKTSSPFIPENYYLQLAVETGLIGLLLFVAGQILLALRLMKNRLLPGAAAAVSVLAGMAVVNMFLHGWADSTTALVFWTIAGVAAGEQT